MIQTNTLLAAAARKGFTLEFIGEHTPIQWVGPYVMEQGYTNAPTCYMVAGDWQVTLTYCEYSKGWTACERHNTVTGTQSRCGAWFDNLIK